MFATHLDHALLWWAHQFGLTRRITWNEGVGIDRRGGPAVLASSETASFPGSQADRPNLVVVVESDRGRAGAAAQAVGDRAGACGASAQVGTIDEIAPADVAAADALIAGCWMPGKTPFGDEPMRRMAGWIDQLPSLSAKPVGVFCTYRFFPHTFADMATRTAQTERGLADCLERKGAVLVAKKAIHFGSIDTDAADLLGKVLEHVA